MPEAIADNVVAIFHYTLKNDAGDVIDSSSGRDPMPYLHGAHNIVPGLEEAMTGKKAGDSFDVTIPPEKGYGLPSGAPPQQIPKSELPNGDQVQVGMQLGAQTPDGQVVVLHVVKVDEASFYVTTDHPLAGENLNFSIEVLRLRDATAEELQHGHPHGPDGNANH